MWSANDIGGAPGSAGGMRLGGHDGLDPGDPAHAVGDVFDRMVFETADLDVDRQHAVVGAAGKAMPFVGNQAALGKQFENARHYPRFRAGAQRKPGERSGGGFRTRGGGNKSG